MRSPRLATTGIGVALALATSPVLAAGLSLSHLLPRIDAGVFELERASADAPSGRASAEVPQSAARGAEAEPDPADREAEDALASPPARPPGQERAPRWKSLLPGALK